jgi:hypothetical protein
MQPPAFSALSSLFQPEDTAAAQVALLFVLSTFVIKKKKTPRCPGYPDFPVPLPYWALSTSFSISCISLLLAWCSFISKQINLAFSLSLFLVGTTMAGPGVSQAGGFLPHF